MPPPGTSVVEGFRPRFGNLLVSMLFLILWFPCIYSRCEPTQRPVKKRIIPTFINQMTVVPRCKFGTGERLTSLGRRGGHSPPLGQPLSNESEVRQLTKWISNQRSTCSRKPIRRVCTKSELALPDATVRLAGFLNA